MHYYKLVVTYISTYLQSKSMNFSYLFMDHTMSRTALSIASVYFFKYLLHTQLGIINTEASAIWRADLQ